MMIVTLRDLMDIVDNMQEQVGNVSRGGNPKEEPKRMLEIKSTTQK